MRTTTRALATMAAIGLLLAACSSTEEQDAASDAPAGDDGDAAPEAAEDGAVDVAVAETDLGEVLVDADGMTLYVFDPDEQGEPTCTDECARSWPPLTVAEEPAAGEGVDGALLGTAERDDGSRQVTYDDWPLYGWASDQSPGDVTGQGVQDVWWVIAPDGTPLRGETADTEADAGAQEETDGVGGY